MQLHQVSAGHEPRCPGLAKHFRRPCPVSPVSPQHGVCLHLTGAVTPPLLRTETLAVGPVLGWAGSRLCSPVCQQRQSKGSARWPKLRANVCWLCSQLQHICLGIAPSSQRGTRRQGSSRAIPSFPHLSHHRKRGRSSARRFLMWRVCTSTNVHQLSSFMKGGWLCSSRHSFFHLGAASEEMIRAQSQGAGSFCDSCRKYPLARNRQ